MEFEVEWDEEERAKWGGVEPDEIDIERRVFYSVLLAPKEQRERDGMSIVGLEAYKDSFYRTGETPAGYQCSACGVVGLKLWRQYNTVASELDLLCGPCALKDQKHDGPIGEDGRCPTWIAPHDDKPIMTDQIGGLVPAIPTEDNSTFWGYTSVPASGVRWWRGLPTLKAA